MAIMVDPPHDPVCYREGQAAFQRGAQRHDCPYRGEANKAWAWAAGWLDAQEAVLLRPCDIPKPKPKIVQIVVMAGGEQGLPALFALRDDGTLWYLFVTSGPGQPWRQVRPIPDEETSDGR